jgi:hypothetical protein
VSSSTTIKAKAFKDGWTASATATSSYVIVRPPSLQGQAMTREGFRLTLSGEVGARYQIFGATDLSEWVILSTVTNEFGTVQFTDGEGTSLPRRFYRAVWKP